MFRLSVRCRSALVGLAVGAAGAVTGPVATAGAAEPVFAPVDRPGPALSVPAAQLDSRLQCSPGLDGAGRAPVLLVQGTGATAKDNWSWTYQPALDKLGIAWCTIDLPDNATSDVQVAGEYVVHAIRTMHRRAGRRIAIIGHSQGGMVPRWALRFWPDTRAMVDDVIGFAPSNHGTVMARCQGGCSAAGWQQSDESSFMKALNSRQETFAGISYTNVYTRTDETVQPNQDALTGSSSLRTGDGRITNVATQDVCPAAVYEHLLVGLVDPVAYALAVDALNNDGPAAPSRVPVTTCAQALHPGINPVTGPVSAVMALQSFSSFEPKQLAAEPPLACYVTGSCAPAAAACVSKRRFVVHVPKRFRFAVRVRLNGRSLGVTGVRGRQSARVDLRGRGPARVTLKITGRSRAGGRLLTETRTYRPCR
ncbi:hypothetical protein DSM112329_04817 [Paraconexibacter sp. AEG42_29]|uniref:Lipase n=1 Tax=Paraconexibacter sp. AEG42_29 TaxID=2997339 RepID=A0AAU7B211_9ACTN